jgi:transcriptional regulator with XRE-family HTH domain
MISAEQCRAARGLLDWSQQDLAFMAAVGVVTIRHLEAGKGRPRRATLDVIRRAFETAGVLFFREDDHAGVGVRLTKAEPTKKPG